MGSKSFNSFSLVSVFIIGAILISQVLVEAEGENIIPFCEKPKYKELCNTMVGKAATPKDASLNALKQTRDSATKFPSLTAVEAKDLEAAQWLFPVLKFGALKQCEYVFKIIGKTLDKSISAVETRDNATDFTHLSDIDVTGCSDAMERLCATSRINKDLHQFKMQVSNCLALVRP